MEYLQQSPHQTNDVLKIDLEHKLKVSPVSDVLVSNNKDVPDESSVIKIFNTEAVSITPIYKISCNHINFLIDLFNVFDDISVKKNYPHIVIKTKIKDIIENIYLSRHICSQNYITKRQITIMFNDYGKLVLCINHIHIYITLSGDTMLMTVNKKKWFIHNDISVIEFVFNQTQQIALFIHETLNNIIIASPFYMNLYNLPHKLELLKQKICSVPITITKTKKEFITKHYNSDNTNAQQHLPVFIRNNNCDDKYDDKHVSRKLEYYNTDVPIPQHNIHLKRHVAPDFSDTHIYKKNKSIYYPKQLCNETTNQAPAHINKLQINKQQSYKKKNKFNNIQQPGIEQGVQPVIEQGVQPGIEQGVQPVIQPVMQPVIPHGVQAVMQPVIETCASMEITPETQYTEAFSRHIQSIANQIDLEAEYKRANLHLSYLNEQVLNAKNNINRLEGLISIAGIITLECGEILVAARAEHTQTL